jgi:hypothetical protein
MSAPEQNCLSCRWWDQPHMDRSERLNVGWCRRRSPIRSPLPDYYGAWPTTLGSEWCGDWKRLASEEGNE